MEPAVIECKFHERDSKPLAGSKGEIYRVRMLKAPDFLDFKSRRVFAVNLKA
jgi:hypothetical protein